jgi:radical SAM superfamily enzyme YgiQ (UPF0313 family)
MPINYFIVYNPLTYNLMDLMPADSITPIDVISYLTGQNAHEITSENFLKYVDFQTEKQRINMIDTVAVELYSAVYIQNQLARLAKDHLIVMLDGKRKLFSRVINEKKQLPRAVFITAMSATFPSAAAVAIVLNHAKIPVIIGGIHVSTMPEDIDTFIRNYVPHPELISIVKGAGDSAVLTEVLNDLDNKILKPEYIGYQLIEDGVWGNFSNVEPLEASKINLLNRLPVIKHTPLKDFRINPVVPYAGCPFSCKFCSISTLPKTQRGIRLRDPDDFVEELRLAQSGKIDFKNRYYIFTPDNLLLGGKTLLTLLDKIIESDLCINYAAQISIDIANDEFLLKKIRESGGTHFFIGLESLDMRNLKHINKHIVKDIEKSGMTVEEYYTSKIKTIHEHGISVHGSFIFGLPYDYFNSFSDNTGVDVAKFCNKNKIGIQPSTIIDLPGSVFFNESQKNGQYLYGKKGTMDYFLSLCIMDLGETNKIPPDSLSRSPLIIAVMVYEATKKIFSPVVAVKNATASFIKAFIHPTKNGKGFNLRQRFLDALCSAVSQIAVTLFKEQANSVAQSSHGVRGIMERLYDTEKNMGIKEQFKHYITQFTEYASYEKNLKVRPSK